MHAKDFGLDDRRDTAGKLRKAIGAAAAEGRVLYLDPVDYHVDDPVTVALNANVTKPWGIAGFGAKVIAQYDAPEPVLLFDVVGNNVSVRFLSIDGLGVQARGQHGLVMRCIGSKSWFYSFSLHRVGVENGDDAIRLEGDVFEGDIAYCHGRDSNCGLAFGNDDKGGTFSAVNVWGGSFSFNRVDGMRTFGPQYREPYDFQIYGTYLGNNGRYAVNARAGVMLMKGVRMENPWRDLAAHDPDSNKERSAVYFMNHARLENCGTGGNGNAASLVDGYLSGDLIVRDAQLWGPTRLARLDGNPGKSFAYIQNSPGEVEASANVVVTRT